MRAVVTVFRMSAAPDAELPPAGVHPPPCATPLYGRPRAVDQRSRDVGFTDRQIVPDIPCFAV